MLWDGALAQPADNESVSHFRAKLLPRVVHTMKSPEHFPSSPNSRQLKRTLFVGLTQKITRISPGTYYIRFKYTKNYLSKCNWTCPTNVSGILHLSNVDLAARADKQELALTAGLQFRDALFVAFGFVAQNSGMDF